MRASAKCSMLAPGGDPGHCTPPTAWLRQQSDKAQGPRGAAPAEGFVAESRLRAVVTQTTMNGSEEWKTRRTARTVELMHKRPGLHSSAAHTSTLGTNAGPPSVRRCSLQPSSVWIMPSGPIEAAENGQLYKLSLSAHRPA